MINQFDVDIKHAFHNQPTQNYIQLWEHYAQIAEKDYQYTLDHLEVYKPGSKTNYRISSTHL